MKNVLMVASEATPFAKTGGLGDVLGALPPALAHFGVDVSVILPKYRGMALDRAEVFGGGFRIQAGWMTFIASFWRQQEGGVWYYFLDCPDLFDRDGIYGDSVGSFGDNHIRFSVLCHGAIELARRLGGVDIFHLHDWQSALTAAYLRIHYSSDALAAAKTIFTIHNLGYQGRFPRATLGDLGLPPEVFRPDLIEFYGDVNLLKAGLVYADAITTVSPTYAREIQTPEYGEGLDPLLRARTNAVSGIVNGCDYSTWNPETDPLIAAPYSARDLSGKRACRHELLHSFGLTPEPDAPVIGIVSRFAWQKGFDLIGAIAPRLFQLPVQMVVLGAGEAPIEEMFRGFTELYPGKISLRTGYDERIAHQIEAGSDLFLMPSRYEPCGLNQMYSMRYGTLPIVRAVGGLEDTVDDETGFKFWGYEGIQLLNCIEFALGVYRNDRSRWDQMQRTAMSRDYSWDASARPYLDLYRRLVPV
jgi:starch synthase